MSLIELMIALLLGVFVISGVIQLFLSSKQSFRLVDGESRVLENGRFALELLSNDIRQTGFLGCSPLSLTSTTTTVIANEPFIAPVTHAGNTKIVGSSSATTPLVISGGNDNSTGTFTSLSPAISSTTTTAGSITTAIKGTDAITVEFGESCGAVTSATTTSVNLASTSTPTTALSAIPATNSCGITQGTGTTYATIGTPLAISDCSTIHLFRASANTSQNKDTSGTATSTLIGKTGGYLAGSEVMLFRSYTFFIGTGASGQPALFRLDNNYPVSGSTNPEELIEGIENMQIKYGIDTDTTLDGSANQYVDMPTTLPADWAKVTSIRVTVTARSPEDNIVPSSTPSAKMTRSYNGSATYSDRRLFKEFTTTIDLRNR